MKKSTYKKDTKRSPCRRIRCHECYFDEESGYLFMVIDKADETIKLKWATKAKKQLAIKRDQELALLDVNCCVAEELAVMLTEYLKGERGDKELVED